MIRVSWGRLRSSLHARSTSVRDGDALTMVNTNPTQADTRSASPKHAGSVRISSTHSTTRASSICRTAPRVWDERDVPEGAVVGADEL